MALKDKLHTLKENYKGKKMAPAFNAWQTFLYTPNETTHNGSQKLSIKNIRRCGRKGKGKFRGARDQ